MQCSGDLVTVDEAKLAADHQPSGDGGPVAGALELAAEARLLDGNLVEAGRFAIEARSASHLKRVIEMALRITPPLVSLRDLRRWRDEGGLPLSDPHRRWLDAAIGAAAGAPTAQVLAEYQAISAAFEESGDVRSEISAGLAAAAFARRIDDVGTLLTFLQRAAEAAAAGIEEARAVRRRSA